MINFLNAKRTLLQYTVIIVSSIMILGCANFSPALTAKYPNAIKHDITKSYTLVEGKEVSKDELNPGDYVQFSADSLRSAPLLRAGQSEQKSNISTIHLPKDPVSLNADGMPLTHFINLALGDVLKLNYIVDSDLLKQKTPITLRVNTPIDAKRMLGLIEEVLLVNNVALVIDDDIIKVIPSKKTNDTVPSLLDKSIDPLLKYGKVVEIIPVYYISISDASSIVRKFLSERKGGQVLMQSHLYSLMVIADRDDIQRIYQLLAEVDVPSRVTSHITLLTPQYVSQENLINDLNVSLSAAGVPVSINKGVNGVVLIPLSNNSILVTASTKSWLDYTLEWVKQLDKPKAIDGSSKGIYVYYMQNAKATDAWSVVSALFGESKKANTKETKGSDLVAAAQQAYKTNGGNSTSNYPSVVPGNVGSRKSSDQQKNTQDMSVVTDNYRVVVDSKQNSIFFTGEYQDYQRLVELLHFVDKRPQQVLLQAVIAELSVSDSYSLGLNINTNTAGSGGDITGGTSFSAAGNLSLVGVFGDFTAKFGASLNNAKVHVLSNPRIIVLDQETASIDIGDQIQVVTGSVTDNGDAGTTTNVYSYISTGISLNITPSINENGLVELEINQEVSSIGTSKNSDTSPPINKRSVETKVLANNGDTIYLGGLIKTNESKSESKVPLLGDIPVLGNLFKYTSTSQDTTELVLLITPYVINSREDALFYTKEFKNMTGWELADYTSDSSYSGTMSQK